MVVVVVQAGVVGSANLVAPQVVARTEQTFLLGLNSLQPLTLGLPLGPLSFLGLLLGPKLLQLGLQHLTPMFQYWASHVHSLTVIHPLAYTHNGVI